MPAISICPKCQRPVSIPRGVESAALVRCPLCAAEYPLGETMPPELIPVVARPTEFTGEPAEATAGGELDDSAWAADVVRAPARRKPAAAPPAREAGAKVAEKENEAVAVARALSATARVWRPRAPGSVLKKLVGVVISGLVGCVVAYYALAFYLGPQFPKLGLPHLPLLFIDRLTTAPSKPQTEKAKSAETSGKAAVSGQVPAEKSSLQPEPPRAAPEQAAVPEKSSSLPPSNEPAPKVESPTTEPKPSRGKPESADHVGPRAQTPITLDQLDKATKEAETLVPDIKADNPLSPAAYQTFCHLGEAMSLVDRDVPADQLIARVAAAKALLDNFVGRPKLFVRLGDPALARIEATPEQNAGILLSGTLKDSALQSDLWTATIQLAHHSNTVTVVSDRKIDVPTGEPVFVLGVVVQKPVVNLVGYDGSQPVVVWAAAFVPAM